MQLAEWDKPAFKQWLLPKLANRTEAEPEVLADFVAELFAEPGSPAEIKRASVEQLSDFLADDTQTFVDEIASAIAQKAWNQPEKKERKKLVPKGKAKQGRNSPTGLKAATANSTLAPDAPAFVPRAQVVTTAPLSSEVQIPTGPRADRNLVQVPTGPRADRSFNGGQNGRRGEARKRKIHEQGNGNSTDSTVSERPYKQLVRRGEGVAGRSGQRGDAPATSAARAGFPSNSTPFAPTLPVDQRPLVLPQFSSYDALDPFNFLANMSAMSAILSMGYSQQASMTQNPNVPYNKLATAKVRCQDFETKGICHLGTLCPYEHSQALVVPADPEYDPNNASLGMPMFNGRRAIDSRSQVPQLGSRHQGQSSRAGQSVNLDDTLAVERIPEDHLNEQHVRDFFSQFGTIVDVRIHTDQRLAIVKFSDHSEARRAHKSPKVIFDNRFVKVYWYKAQPQKPVYMTKSVAEKDGIPAIYHEDEELIDLDEFRKQQAQVQKEFEEKRRMVEEATARFDMLNVQVQTKEAELDNLRSTMIEKAKAKGLKAIVEKESRVSTDLKKLQAEAEGIFANAPVISREAFINGRGSSRGNFRGREWRGRGNNRGGRGGVIRLDNRPRSLAIAGVKAGSAKERAVKDRTLTANGCTGVCTHSESADTLVVGFEQRFQAELFIDEATDIPHVSMADLSWVAQDGTVVQQSVEMNDAMDCDEVTDGQVDGKAELSDGQGDIKVEVDLDVADDMDQWL